MDNSMPTKGIILHVGSVVPTAACAPLSLANTAGAISRKRANVQDNGRRTCFIIYRLSFNCTLSFTDNYKHYNIGTFNIILVSKKNLVFLYSISLLKLIVYKEMRQKKKLWWEKKEIDNEQRIYTIKVT